MQEMSSFMQAKPAHPMHSFTLRGAGMGAETPDQDSFFHRGSTTEL